MHSIALEGKVGTGTGLDGMKVFRLNKWKYMLKEMNGRNPTEAARHFMLGWRETSESPVCVH